MLTLLNVPLIQQDYGMFQEWTIMYIQVGFLQSQYLKKYVLVPQKIFQWAHTELNLLNVGPDIQGPCNGLFSLPNNILPNGTGKVYIYFYSCTLILHFQEIHFQICHLQNFFERFVGNTWYSEFEKFSILHFKNKCRSR